MDITYVGHSCFKLKGKGASVITDPFNSSVGFSLPRLSADIITISHDHEDHNNIAGVAGTARRKNPFVIDAAGEYEVNGVGVFGIDTFHDESEGKERGKNLIFSILIDGISVVHLGDLGHTLSDKQVSELNGVDVLICPVGGVYTIDADKASEVLNAIEPSIFIPMHYKTTAHNEKFQDLIDVETFVKKLSTEVKHEEKLTLSKMIIPEELEVVVLETRKDAG